MSVGTLIKLLDMGQREKGRSGKWKVGRGQTPRLKDSSVTLLMVIFLYAYLPLKKWQKSAVSPLMKFWLRVFCHFFIFSTLSSKHSPCLTIMLLFIFNAVIYFFFLITVLLSCIVLPHCNYTLGHHLKYILKKECSTGKEYFL